MALQERLKHAWNAFRNKDPSESSSDYDLPVNLGPAYIDRPRVLRSYTLSQRSIIASIYNKISLDAASVKVEHVKVDEAGRYSETIDSSLNYILTEEANIDQTAFAFKQDVFYSMLETGHVAIFPENTDVDVRIKDSFKMSSVRAGKIVQWFPKQVLVEGWNSERSTTQQIYLPKSAVAIIENPFYSVMNEPNSILQRLIKKLNQLDAIDDQSGSGKLDLIIQLPYALKSELRQQQAETRKKQLEEQLENSKYGIGYIDATEHVTQLNRAVENNLMGQIEYLTKLLYSQLGLTDDIMSGLASEEVMQNYYKRVIGAILEAFVQEISRKFLTKTARSQNQRIMYFNDPFRFTAPEKMADIADKFTRNEILEANYIRTVMGIRPSEDPKADELHNANLSQPKWVEDERYNRQDFPDLEREREEAALSEMLDQNS